MNILGWVVLPYVIVQFLCGFLLLETENYPLFPPTRPAAAFYIALLAVIVAAQHVLHFAGLPKTKNLRESVVRVFGYVAFPVVLAFMSPGTIALANAAFVSEPTQFVGGTVESIENDSNRRTGATFYVTITYADRKVVLPVSAQEHERIRIGDYYQRKMTLGRLEHFFRWRF
jgi:hypothetical protein